MTLHSVNNPATPDIDGLKSTKAFCESIANNPAAYSETERKAAEVMAGQMRHWIFNASQAPDQAYGTSVSAQMAKHRLDSLKVSATPKLEDLIADGELMAQQLANQAQLITDMANHIKQLKLPNDLKTRLLAGASATMEGQIATTHGADSTVKVA
jgi:hypothetical protein